MFLILTKPEPTRGVTVKSISNLTVFLQAVGTQPSVRVVSAAEASLSKYIAV